MSLSNQPLAAIISHNIADYDQWKAGFDAHQKAREEVGITAHCLNRIESDDNSISAYFLAKDQGKLEAFFSDPKLAEAMKAAGVTSPPSILFVRQQEDCTIWDRPLPAAVVVHDVKDYATWKAAFDAHAEARKGAGIIAHAVNRSVEDQNRVVIFLQAEDSEALNSFLSAPELGEAMAAAGVLSKPHITMVKTVERVDY